MRVLSVASEIYPLVKTGGLADVVGALPGALARLAIEVRTLVPGYPAVMSRLEGRETVDRRQMFGGPAEIVAGRAAALDLFVIDAPHLFDRPGNPYTGPNGQDWPDNAQRFAALSQAAAWLGAGGAPAFTPHVLHAHDWQAGLAPAYLHYSGGRRPATVMTVHNLAFQGSFPAHLLAELGLPATAFSVDGVEYYGGIGFLKAGLQLADAVTTVSPTYAAEIATPEAGMGLDGLIRASADRVFGILNGIDEIVWNPATDPHLAARYSADTLERRPANKRALLAGLALAEPEGLLLGVVSRLSAQKGLDLLLDALPDLLTRGHSVVLLGAGDPALEDGFRAAAAAAPDRVGVVIGYDEVLAHMVQGGVDAFLVPSRFEPCGLTQLCAMRYGAVPIVARVGGLNDTIIDGNEMALAAGVATGFQFAGLSAQGLARAVGRADAVWRDGEAWRTVQANGMRQDLGWTRPAARYAELYRRVASGVNGGRDRD